MEIVRKPLQGTVNIIRFNWHFYLLALIAIVSLLLTADYFPSTAFLCYIGAVLILLPLFISLSVSFFAYDFSPLYSLPWLGHLSGGKNQTIVNIHAGFDETSGILKQKLPHDQFYVFDFYDPAKHTEVSIKRARKIYPATPGTKTIRTNHIPLPNHSVDKAFIIFSAHEIRDRTERICFFKELNRIVKLGGEILVTEHLRNLSNFLAYNIGFLHFYPLKSWQNVFGEASLKVSGQVKTTPFITTFILTKNGIES